MDDYIAGRGPTTKPNSRRNRQRYSGALTAGHQSAATTRKPVKAIGRNQNVHYDENGRKKKRGESK